MLWILDEKNKKKSVTFCTKWGDVQFYEVSACPDKRKTWICPIESQPTDCVCVFKGAILCKSLLNLNLQHSGYVHTAGQSRSFLPVCDLYPIFTWQLNLSNIFYEFKKLC